MLFLLWKYSGWICAFWVVICLAMLTLYVLKNKRIKNDTPILIAMVAMLFLAAAARCFRDVGAKYGFSSIERLAPVQVLQVKQLAMNGAMVGYLDQGLYKQNNYQGPVMVSVVAKSPRVKEEICQNWFGVQKVILKDLVVPVGYFNH
ncbi:hypothetical protein CEB3_c13450 [Peptococcaceae bacterium CEB3]|nr:hypothetical protein CEB3_c13450 [Peptococcaceae bacterium CEB3]